jgi:hypothetical protein
MSAALLGPELPDEDRQDPNAAEPADHLLAGGASDGPEYSHVQQRLPEHPSAAEWLTHVPRVFACYLQRLASAFGWQYVAAVVSVYGIGQRAREKQIGGSGGSLEPPGPLLEPPAGSSYAPP